ncbi:MAG: hypothetical protein ABEJ87_03725 [Candidatus Nanohalobium sp.]
MKHRLGEKFEALKQFTARNKALTAYWLLFTGILLFQHTQGWNWDFLVYLMNGEYLFHSGFFMEWLRPPLAPFLMGLLQFVFSRTVTGYVYILFSSAVFLYAVKKLSDAEGLDTLAMTVFVSAPAFISFATREGTELLALALLMLFLADLEKPRTGIWLGLSVLTRWTQGLMLPLILLQKDARKIVKTGLLFGSVFVPWMIYSYMVVGDPLASPVSFVTLNLLLGKLTTPPQLIHFLEITLPSLTVLLLAYREDVRSRLKASVLEDRTSWAMIYIAAGTAFVYFASQITHLRYLFQLTLPVAYFAAKAWNEVDHQKLIYIFIAANLLLGFQASLNKGYESPNPYQRAAKNINCMVESDSWVPLDYAGLNAESPVDDNTTVERLRNGWRVLDFTGGVIDSEKERQVADLLRDKGAYRVYGIEGRCAEPVNSNTTRIDEYNTAHDTDYKETEFMIDLVLRKIS